MLNGERKLRIELTELIKLSWDTFQILYRVNRKHIFISSKYDTFTPLQYSCLENPWVEEPGGLQSMGSLRVAHNWETSLSLFTFMFWRRKWQPTRVFLPGESQGQGSLVGCRLGVAQSRTQLKQLSSIAAAWLIHIVVWQKPNQYSKAIILQLEIHFIIFKKEIHSLQRQITDL